MTATIAIVLAITMLGTIVQGVAGTGFGMVVVVVFVWLFGPVEGVLLGNILGCINAITYTAAGWRDIEWRTMLRLSVGAVPAMAAALVTIHYVSETALDLGVGILLAVLVTFSFLARFAPPTRSSASQYLAGFLSGFCSTCVAQSGPVLVAYAQASRWDHRHFAATIQPFFVFINLFNVPAKIAFAVSAGGLTLSWSVVATALVAIAVGVVISRRLARIIPASTARLIALTIASVGAVVIAGRGIVGLLT